MTLGRIILLNGASSSGKSTLARAVQDSLDTPLPHLTSDQLVDGGALPRRREAAGPFAWVGEMRPRFFDGFHRSVASRRERRRPPAALFAAWRDRANRLSSAVAGWRLRLARRMRTLERPASRGGPDWARSADTIRPSPLGRLPRSPTQPQ